MARAKDFVDASIDDDVEFDEFAIVAVDTGEIDTVLNPEDARQLTDTIRNAAEMLWMLISRAHQGRAWEALGYDTWEAYVRAEFDMSRSRSYQILDQGRVIKAIEAVLPDGTDVSLSEAAARDLKGVLDEVLPQIAEQTDGLPPSEAALVLDEIVEEQRDLIRSERNAAAEDDDDFDEYDGGGTSGGSGDGNYRSNDYSDDAADAAEDIYDDVDDIDITRIRRNVNAAHDIYSSLAALASLPDDMAEVIAIIPEERHRQIDTNLVKALANLKRFDDLWRGTEDSDAELVDEDN